MRLRALLLAVAAAAASAWLACQGGVLSDQGNGFPCDFSQPEGVRDLACAAGDVCGVDNVCRGFHYEGPQFEARPDGAPLPDFSAATLLHPGVLNQPMLGLTRSAQRRPAAAQGIALMGTPGALQAVALTVGVDTTVVTAPFDSSRGDLLAVAEVGDWAALVLDNGPMVRTFVLKPASLNGTATQVRPAVPVLLSERLRAGNDVAVLLRNDTAASTAGELDDMAQYTPLDIDSGELDGGTFHPLEARYVPASLGPKDDLLMLGDDGFWLRRPRVGMPDLARVTALDVGMPAHLTRPTLRNDVTGSIWAFAWQELAGSHVLSSWRLDRSVTATMARLWNDCSPCKGGRIVAFVPVLNGAAEVQVLCATRTGGGAETLSLTRVVGSGAIDEGDECLLEPAEPAFPLAQLNFVPGRFDAGVTVVVQDDANGGGIMLGGRGGQVWGGASLTSALPLFLERTPVAFGTFVAPDGGVLPVALTDRYLAVPRVSGMGFEALDLHRASDVALAEDVVVAAMMGQAPGWGILSSGDVVHFDPSDGGLQFGPRLVDGRGAPALSPFFGEGAEGPNEGLVSFVMAANDSVYFAPVPAALTATQDTLPEVTPQLTPAPGSPIRSMTLERSAVGTDGVSRVRGYLVAGRQLFLFTLSGNPSRWSATPILLQGGEPVEVWMDNPLGGLGRVGYRDGEVFTLPGGFPLVNPLPRGDGGVPVQVLDYENLGGWPVAMSSVGLFVAQWPKVGVHLQNRFPDGGEGKPMDWNEVTLSDGGRPWLGKSARLQVVRTGVPYVQQIYHLLVYTDDAVLEVGTLTRK